MKIDRISDKVLIERFLRKDPFLHLYSIGDLDDFFWPDTSWFVIHEKQEIKGILLLYQDIQYPVLLALGRKRLHINPESFRQLTGCLPDKLYAHITDNYRLVLNQYYSIKSNGKHFKMGLFRRSKSGDIDTTGVETLTGADERAIKELLDVSYPGNWFNERMLETGHYYGVRKNGNLISIAGVHVFSEKYRVASLGNITTHPDFRGQGYSTRVTAHLCSKLTEITDHIGLNVHKDNYLAINTYKKLGFEITDEYEECVLTYIPEYI